MQALDQAAPCTYDALHRNHRPRLCGRSKHQSTVATIQSCPNHAHPSASGISWYLTHYAHHLSLLQLAFTVQCSGDNITSRASSLRIMLNCSKIQKKITFARIADSIHGCPAAYGRCQYGCHAFHTLLVFIFALRYQMQEELSLPLLEDC